MTDFYIVGIGASAGGIEVLYDFFPILPVINKELPI